MTTTITTAATMAKITWRVANVYGSAVRVRVAEKTMKQPATVRTSWASSRTQSMLRLGSAGLERMLPRPESGLRCSIERPIGVDSVLGAGRHARGDRVGVRARHAGDVHLGEVLGRLFLGGVERLGQHDGVEGEHVRQRLEHALHDRR